MTYHGEGSEWEVEVACANKTSVLATQRWATLAANACVASLLRCFRATEDVCGRSSAPGCLEAWCSAPCGSKAQHSGSKRPARCRTTVGGA
jgi:hypothetical protein